MNIIFQTNTKTDRHKLIFEELTGNELDSLRIILQTLKKESKFFDNFPLSNVSLDSLMNSVIKDNNE